MDSVVHISDEEAITIIKNEFSKYADTLSVYAEKRKIAFDKAIEALEQQSKGVTVTDFADRCHECGAEYGKLLESMNPKGPVKPEPFINKPCISEGVCHEDKMQTLDKLRVEIEQTADEEYKHDEKWAIGLRYAVKIIDKYRTEEGEE